MKKIIAAMVLALCLPGMAWAEPVDYSDDYISFQYDDDVFQVIDVFVSGSEASYSVVVYKSRDGEVYDSAHVIMRVQANADPGYLETFFDRYTDGAVSYEDISDTEKIIHKKDGRTQYAKFLWAGKDQYIYVSLYIKDEDQTESQYCRRVYESLRLSDAFDDEVEYSIEDNEVMIDIEDQIIFQNAMRAN